MFRSILVLVVTLLGFFTVMAGVVVIGSMRLRSSWADVGTPVVKPTHPAELAGTPIGATPPKPVTPLVLDEETDLPEHATLYLPADQAKLSGHARLDDRRGAKPPPPKPDKLSDRDKNKKRKRQRDDPRLTMAWIADMRTPDDVARWSLSPATAEKYEIDLTYGCGQGWGGDFIISVGGHDLPAHTQSTRNPEEFKVITLSTIALPAGPTTLTLRPARPLTGGPLMNLKEVKLIPAN